MGEIIRVKKRQRHCSEEHQHLGSGRGTTKKEVREVGAEFFVLTQQCECSRVVR